METKTWYKCKVYYAQVRGELRTGHIRLPVTVNSGEALFMDDDEL